MDCCNAWGSRFSVPWLTPWPFPNDYHMPPGQQAALQKRRYFVIGSTGRFECFLNTNRGVMRKRPQTCIAERDNTLFNLLVNSAARCLHQLRCRGVHFCETGDLPALRPDSGFVADQRDGVFAARIKQFAPPQAPPDPGPDNWRTARYLMTARHGYVRGLYRVHIPVDFG